MTGQVPKTRLARVLLEQRKRLGSYDRIAEQISRACEGEGIDRRKLKKLAEGGDVTLKISELARMDAYLSQIGEGLTQKPLFEAPGILQALGESGDVALLYGSYPHPDVKRTDLVHWDIRSAATLTRDIQRFGQGTHLRMHDIFNREGEEITGKESWFELLEDDGPSVVSIGSPRACPATEAILAKMFDKDIGRTPVFPQTPLPFYLVWPSNKKRSLRSSFSIPPRGFETYDKENNLGFLEDHDALGGLLTTEKFYCDRKIRKMESTNRGTEERDAENTSQQTVVERSTSHGIIAAQRRPNGRLWLVLSGLSGPATYACAKLLQSVLVALPSPGRTGEPSPVMWLVVSASILWKDSESMPGDARVLTGQQLVGDPRYWSPPKDPV